mgnify:CR=1 FL=1
MSGIESTIVDFLKLTFLSMVPFILASQGTMLGGRTGVFSVSQEGIMLVGASVGFLVSYLTGSNLLGALVAMAVGGVFGLILAYFTTTLKMDQFVVGLALFFIGTGLSSLLPKLVIGVTLTPPLVPTLPDIAIPLLSKIPVIGPILFNQNIMVYISVLLSIGLWYYMFHTNSGLRMRSRSSASTGSRSISAAGSPRGSALARAVRISRKPYG